MQRPVHGRAGGAAAGRPAALTWPQDPGSPAPAPRQRAAGGRPGWSFLALVLAWWCVLGLAAPAAWASTYTTGSNNCAGCHSGPPPDLLSQSAAYATPSYNPGKIIPLVNDGALDQSCATSPCALRTKMNNNVNMGASVTASFTPAELETIRLYLLRVRDGVVGTPGTAPSFAAAVVGGSSTSSFSIPVSNYRGVRLNVALSVTGTHASDFTITTQGISGTGCTSGVLPATTAGQNPATCTLSGTLTFRPTASGARSANLHVTLTRQSALDPNPVDTTADKDVALNGTATAAAPGFTISTSTLALSSPVGTPINSAAITIGNPAGATANLLLGSLATATTFSGSASADYALATAASSPCTTAGTTLAPGASCNLVVRFTPGAKGARNAVLTIPHNAAGNPQTVSLNGTGQQGTVSFGSLAPSPFGSVNLGSSAQRTLAVSNSGDAPLGFTSITAGGDFSVNASACSSPLAAGGVCTLTLTFTPTAAGARSATLTVNSNASNTPATLALSGSGVGLADPTLSPASLAAFPATDVDTTSTTTRAITITNPRANPLSYTAGFGGANAADFTVGAESCPTRVIAAGGACTLTLRFTPAAGPGAGTRIAALGLAFTGSGSDPSPATQTVALSGTATVPAPLFAISANPITFSTTVGTPVTASAIVSNTGNAALTLSALSFGGSFAAEYALAPSNSCVAGTPIAAGASCTLAIRFAPAAAGSRGATLTIADNAAGSPRSIALNGSASAAPQPAIDLGGTTALAFNSVPLGSSTQQSFSVRNTGAAPLNLAALTISGSAAGDYSRGGSCAAGAAVPAGASCSVTITFAPQAAGARSALLTISSDASNTPSRSVGLSGDGVALPDPLVTPLPLDPFPSTQVGSSSTVTRTLTILNPRGNALGYARSLGGANPGDFAVLAESCPARVVPAGGLCTLSLQFMPTAAGGAGSRSAALTLSFTGSGADPAPPAQSVALAGTAALAAPVFAMSSNPIGFSAVVGTPAVGSAVITNGGSVVLTLASLTFGGAFAADYTLAPASTCAAGTALAAGGSCTLAIRFAPAAVGSRAATLTIAHNAAGSPQAVTLNGTATAAPQPAIDLAGLSALAFGTTALGSSSAPQAFDVRNIGTAPLTLGALTLTGAAPGDFSRAGSCAAGAVVAAGASCTVTITFTPSASGARTAVLGIASDASNTPPAPSVALSGSGSGLADPLVSPAVVTPFPATDVGSVSSVTRVVTVTNPRANPLSYVRSFGGVNAADFSIAAESCPTGAVPAGGSCTLTLRFAPAAGGAAGTRIAALGLAFTGSGSDPSPATQTVALAGTAQVPAPLFAIASNPIGFTTVVGTPVSASTLISNGGSAALTLSALTFGGSFGAEYALSPASGCVAGSVIAAAGSCTLTIVFTPAAAGSRDATLTIAHDAAGSPQLVSLGGVATAAAQPSIDFGGTSALSFTGVPLGSSAQQSFGVRNTGGAPLNISALTLSGNAAGDYSRGGSCAVGVALAAGASCSVTVTFTPTATGTRSALLTVVSDAGNTPSRSVALNGDAAALPEPLVSPQPIDPFPPTQVGATSTASRVLTIVNPRANALSYTAAVSGANAADFALAAESCPTHLIAAGGICTITLQFTPAAAGGAGVRGATLLLSFTGSGADPAPPAQSLALAGTAALAAPAFSISAGTLNLAAVVGASATAAAVITNTGSAPLLLGAVDFGGGFAADYSLAPANGCSAALSLAPSSSCTLVIRFAPPAAGNRDATVSVTHNAAGSPQTLTLHGTATAAPQGRLELSVQRTLGFADTALGSSSAQTITVQNTGDAALNFSALAISGAAAADFERAGSCAVGVALGVNQPCSVVVTFRPTAIGVRSAAITFQSDASNGAATIALSGNGVAAPAPQVTLSPATLAFGAQTLGGIYPTRTLRLTNTGSADLTGIAVSVSGAGFTDASAVACPPTLAAGASCDIAVAFAPTAAGTAYSGGVAVTSNAAGSPHRVALSGSGTLAAVPVLSLDSASSRLDFGVLSAGSVSPSQSALITNQGPGGAVISLLNAVGADAASFPVSAGSCVVGQVLFEGASCRVDVRFAPGSAGQKNATVQVASTGNFASTLSLTGTGLSGPNASLAVSATRLSFESTRVGAQSLPVELTLSSDGSGVVRVSGLETSGPYAVQAKSCPALPFTLPSGSACTVTVTFQPQADGAATGTLRVISDADPAQREVGLDGSGVPKADVASGGCSMAAGDSLFDPTWWALLALAAVALCRRRWERQVAARGVQGQGRRDGR